MKSLAKEKTISEEEIKSLSRNSTNNNHHVVPLGILIVLCTIYLTVAGLQRNYIYYVKTGVAASNLPPPSTENEFQLESQDKPTCPKLQIFQKDISKPFNDDNLKTTTKTFSALKSLKRNRNSKNGKHLEAKKKDSAKKSNTAEPIIYLFALVFIYLLLKAASDINQHYKSNKGDKRLRRCSLQSYAQAHKQDRRASKVPDDSPLLQRRQAILREVRSISVDRYKYTIAEEVATGGQQPMVPLYRPKNSSIAALAGGGGDAPAMPLNRRSSVPININPCSYPQHSAQLVKRGSVISLSSLAPLPLGPDPANPTLPESSKRRVRMINRH